MRVGIVMTYYNRRQQLARTLATISKTGHSDFFVVVVDDQSEQPPDLTYRPCDVTYIRVEGKQWTNPEPAYNTGIHFAMQHAPDVVILQNAECYHAGDVVRMAATVTDKNYISFGCLSLSEANTFNDHDLPALIARAACARFDGDDAWYNHPTYRPAGYDFCAAITARNLRLLNGYDERFSAGCGYGDDYLLARVRRLGLTVQITDWPIVVHQWHYNNAPPADKAARIERNRLLFAQLSGSGDVRAQHIYTPDL